MEEYGYSSGRIESGGAMRDIKIPTPLARKNARRVGHSG
jgi:hypothetical protein